MKQLNSKSIYWFIPLTLAGLMSITMPSCPGQEALQQQVDAASSKNTELTRKVNELTSQFKPIQEENNKLKELTKLIGDKVLALETKIKELEDANVKLSQSLIALQSQSKTAPTKPISKSNAKTLKKGSPKKQH
jgi:predicted nuclease with TOPRIM domain